MTDTVRARLHQTETLCWAPGSVSLSFQSGYLSLRRTRPGPYNLKSGSGARDTERELGDKNVVNK